VSICTKSTGHLEEAVLQVLVTLDVFWAERVNLQEKYDDPTVLREIGLTDAQIHAMRERGIVA